MWRRSGGLRSVAPSTTQRFTAVPSRSAYTGGAWHTYGAGARTISSSVFLPPLHRYCVDSDETRRSKNTRITSFNTNSSRMPTLLETTSQRRSYATRYIHLHTLILPSAAYIFFITSPTTTTTPPPPLQPPPPSDVPVPIETVVTAAPQETVGVFSSILYAMPNAFVSLMEYANIAWGMPYWETLLVVTVAARVLLFPFVLIPSSSPIFFLNLNLMLIFFKKRP